MTPTEPQGLASANPNVSPAHGGFATDRTFTLTLQKHTGFLVFMRRQRSTVRGTFEQCEAAYKAAQLHNLLFGWWGILSMLAFNWIALLGNASAMGQLRKVAAHQES